ncbi:MAG TPA: histidine kinase, partial [Firmicutes bacterium]|nr:histidine kinase [Bacillota bacterium]
MSIWFYLFLIVLCLSIFLILKIIIMKNEINNIGKSISSIINTDTNNLITISTND